MDINPNICQACLSSDRKLHPVSKLRNIVDELRLTEILAGGVCFECRTNMVSFFNFKIKIQQAQQNLREMTDLKCLSSLSLSPPQIYQYQPLLNHSETNIKKIKEFANNYYFYDQYRDDKNNLNDKHFDEHNKNNSKNGDLVDEIDSVIYFGDCEEKINDSFDDTKLSDNQACCEFIVENEDRFQINQNNEVYTDSKSSSPNIAEKDSLEKNTERESRYIKKLNAKGKIDIEENIKCLFLTHKELLEYREKQKNQIGYKTNPYKCENCVLSFLKLELLEDHIHRNHNESHIAYVCDICKMRFFCEKIGRKHHKRHYVIYKCKLCDYESNELWVTWGHHQKNHKNEDSVKIRTLEENTKNTHGFQCEMCGENFKAKNTMLRHTRIIHGNQREFICDLCKKTFKTKTRLESHIAGHNSALAKKLSYCALCKVQYKNIYVYRNHLKNSVNHAQESIQCTECSSKFASKAYWKKHYNFYHLQKSRYKCENCDKIFISECRLKSHRQMYHGLSRSRNYSCNVCGKKFFTLGTLKGHKLTHSEERSFMCEDCGDTFKQRPALYTHYKLVHKGLKRLSKNTQN